MHAAPKAVGGVFSSTLPHRVFLFLAAVSILGVMFPSVGMAQSGTAQTAPAKPPVQQTPANELKALRQKAEQGDAEAQYRLGEMYERGRGLPMDYVQAVDWYRKAAEQGYVLAQMSLSGRYFDGHGVPQDSIEAYKWANLAAAPASGEPRQDAAKLRDLLARTMTHAQIAEAQKRASEWLAAFKKTGVQRGKKVEWGVSTTPSDLTLEQVVGASDAVVVAEVISAQRPVLPNRGTRTLKGGDWRLNPPGAPVTPTTVRIEQIVYDGTGTLSLGAQISIPHPGGTGETDDFVISDSTAPLKVGASYVLFLKVDPQGGYLLSAGPLAEMELESGHITTAMTRGVAGTTLADLIVRVKEARSRR